MSFINKTDVINEPPKHYLHVFLTSNTDEVQEYINVPFPVSYCKAKINYRVDPADTSSDEVYLVWSDLNANRPIGALAYSVETDNGVFSLQNEYVRGTYTFRFLDSNKAITTLAGVVSICLEFW